MVQKRRVPCDPLTLTFQGDLASIKRAWPERKLAQMRCVDIMLREWVTVGFSTPLEQAWALLRERRIKALPVVDRTFRIAGIITLADFMRAAELDGYEGFSGKLRQLVRTTPSIYSDKPEVAGQIMTRNVRVSRSLSDSESQKAACF